MSEPIDLNAERNKRAQPDQEFRSSDAFGRPMFTFTCSYEHDGKPWVLTFWAYDWDDAVAKVGSIVASLKLEGQVFSGVPA